MKGNEHTVCRMAMSREPKQIGPKLVVKARLAAWRVGFFTGTSTRSVCAFHTPIK
jgi:hypothetical protein